LHGTGTFSKAERLQRGWQFRRVYEAGQCLRGRLLVLYVMAEPSEPTHVGVVTSRRIGNAVVRNRARRLLREAYRLNKQKLNDHLQLVMVARSAIRDRKLRDVEAEMLSLWQKAGIVRAY